MWRTIKTGVFSLSCLFLWSSLHAAPSKWVDGKIEIAVATVNGIVCWNSKERDEAIAYITDAGTQTLTVEDYHPASFEVSVSTSGIQFRNHEDFKKAIASSAYLKDKIDDMRPSEKRKHRPTIDFVEAENLRR